MGRPKKGSEKNSKKEWQVPDVSLDLHADTKRDISIICLIVVGLITALAEFGLAGSFGIKIFGFLQILFGMIAYFFPIGVFALALLVFKEGRLKDEDEEDSSVYLRIYLGAFVFLAAVAGLIHIFYISPTAKAFEIATAGKGGGLFGAIFAGPLFNWLGLIGAVIVLIAFGLIGVVVAFNFAVLAELKKMRSAKQEESETTANAKRLPINTQLKQRPEDDDEEEEDEEEEKKPQPININTQANKLNKIEGIDGGLMPAVAATSERKDWKLPPFELLEEGISDVDSGNIETNVAIIQKTLGDFNIEVEMGEVNVGPTVTQYTLRPSTGVKLSQIAALQNDLALSLAAQSLRMELPIPGKPLVGIEVPNRSTAIVRLRDVMQDNSFINFKTPLALALGRDVAGVAQIVDLAKMPHMLIAGATGTGKSVAINSLFISLLFRNTPTDAKYILIDPKRVEMSLYNGIPHLLTPVITDHDKAVNALKWAVAEMDRRYRLLADVGKRNIVEYNESTELKLSYIVIIIDELADLMAVAQADVEAAIVRLAQMARAIGIHLVVATQRPSVDIITGLIKANITSRIAFAVASQIDSRTILDTSGAEKLLGNGDMLFTSAESSKPKRIQGCYINEKEVKKVVDFFKQQTGAVIYNEEITAKPKTGMSIPGFSSSEDGDVDDDLYSAAVEEVTNAGKASASFLQRRLRIGYARAARLLDILEERGIIGPGDGAKPREVYGSVTADPAQEEQNFEE